MEEQYEYHPMGCPAVNIPDKPPSGDNEYNILYRLISPLNRGCIIHHQNKTGKNQDEEKKTQNDSQAKSVCRFEVIRMNPGGMDVEKKVSCYLFYPVDPVSIRSAVNLTISLFLRVHKLSLVKSTPIFYSILASTLSGIYYLV